ncbi:hypothetical protein [Spirosoma linguale]|uniref:Lipoprotein n=1 Tax=Spirosoma linguale (strain ATCC 33905 / DSM 74 / LMG 10896 / Claus 1) TaxID=504472 RepID=D2QBC9_SPILD|nr:hypothetical protein Slin_0037 [Spirosoma linguale DSM 74]
MKNSYSAFAISFLMTLTSCSNVYIQSNVNRDERTDFTRILVVSNLTRANPAYLASFQTAFPQGYQVCSVSNSPLSFDSPQEAIQKQQQTCQSEVMLTIDFSRNYLSGYGKYISSNDELLLQLVNISNGKPFWKAVVTTSGSNEVSANQVVNQLIKDGIIKGNLPGQKYYRSDY